MLLAMIQNIPFGSEDYQLRSSRGFNFFLDNLFLQNKYASIILICQKKERHFNPVKLLTSGAYRTLIGFSSKEVDFF